MHSYCLPRCPTQTLFFPFGNRYPSRCETCTHGGTESKGDLMSRFVEAGRLDVTVHEGRGVPNVKKQGCFCEGWNHVLKSRFFDYFLSVEKESSARAASSFYCRKYSDFCLGIRVISFVCGTILANLNYLPDQSNSKTGFEEVGAFLGKAAWGSVQSYGLWHP